MSIEEKRRAAFDKWWPQYKGFASQNDGEAWDAWSAALDSVEIELPDADCFDVPSFAAPAIRECREAIEAAGLKVKP